ncbi:DNA-nicking Smr family endonuclease [Methylorubrum rhodinum]|uniref:DNA-nicking Smr family endonuclease n=1 Tax=Methylorubrum rhodinum TaxID=29428 RepID=A0A840ZFB3_9HYPH|nr:Smr/MutS family protein [Methylorubrum rhodinum]MBB5755865.1 DNA-nicking Smr family endonuclease [Methylorubrum rhodinum]
MRPPRRRALSREEAYLWGEIAKLITPLRGRARPKKPAPEAEPAAPASAKPSLAKPSFANSNLAKPTPSKPAVTAPPTVKTAPKTALSSLPTHKRPVKLGDLTGGTAAFSAPARPPAAAPPPPGLERKERRGLERGTLAIEARIDLHGLYQAEAHAALVGFLMRARSAGHARVLVVTGKGGEGFSDAGFSERGVLRRTVPHWLRGPELRGFVLGFEEAARHHGGAGALYVRLRRR